MKKLFLFFSISFSLQAQSDSLKVTFSEEKVEKFEKTTLIDEYEKAFGSVYFAQWLKLECTTN